MNSIFGSVGLPQDIPIEGASFYSKWGSARQITSGDKNGHRYIVFTWDVISGENRQFFSVVAINLASPVRPETWLSKTSGLQLERVGDWVFAYEPDRPVEADAFDSLVQDAFNLIEYAGGFPQNS